MDIQGLLMRAERAGLRLWAENNTLQVQGKRTAESETILAELGERWRLVLMVMANRDAGCPSELTAHTAHEYSWECDPDTCYCYGVSDGTPKWCRDVPCRWVWGDNHTYGVGGTGQAGIRH